MPRVLGSATVRDTRDPYRVTYWRAVMYDKLVGTGYGSVYATEYSFLDEGSGSDRWRATGSASVPKHVYRELREKLRRQRTGEDRDPPSVGERTRRRRQKPARVQFRKLDEDLAYDVKEGDVIAIFVDDKSPQSIPKTRYYHFKHGAQWDFLGNILSASHRANPREYSRLERHLTRDHGYRLIVL